MNDGKVTGAGSTPHVHARADEFASYQEWRVFLDQHPAIVDERWDFEIALAALDPADVWVGFCALCEERVRFRLPRAGAGEVPNLREQLICEQCQTNARVRAAFSIAREATTGSDARIYVTEQASPTFVWLQRRYPNAIGSEYITDPASIRTLANYFHDLGGRGDIRFEDVTALSFGDGGLDAAISFDVLEHVPEYRSALREFARVLRKDGVLVLTAPFASLSEQTLVRARLRPDGGIEHLMPAEYHGDPLGEKGILCFYHFGWDLLEQAREAGFSRVHMALPWDPSLGLAGSLWTLVAYK